MIVLAVLLLLVVAAAVAFILVTGSATDVTLAWSQISISVVTTALAVFLLGAITLFIAEVGVGLLLRGNRKNRERRRELKRLRRVERDRTTTPTGTRPSTPSIATSSSAERPAAGGGTHSAGSTAADDARGSTS